MSFIRYMAKLLAPEFVSPKGTPFREQWYHPAAPANTGIHAAITCPTSGTTVVTTAITNPDFPRNVRIKGNQASVTGNVLVTGLDQFGKAKTDTIASNGTAAVDGVIAFKTITSITIPTRGAASDTISLGPGPLLGLSRHLAAGCNAGVVGGDVDGTREATMPVVEATYHTVSFTTALAATKTYTFYYHHEDLANA